MASRTVVELVDDLDGSPADETVAFGLDGQSYEIDLTEEHAERLRAAVGKFRPYARRVRKRAGAARRQSGRQQDGHAIREWAREHGYPVSRRGRIAQEIVQAYAAAHGS